MKVPMDSPLIPVARTALAVLLAVIPPAGFLAQQGSAVPAGGPTLAGRVVQSALEQTTYTRFYDPAYVRLSYPGGDVPRERGVCTDVIIRAFRAAGIDLQREVHLDMAANFSAYPRRWGHARPDRNIDHRRVPNLMTYFRRQGKELPLSDDPAKFLPGDVVVWDLGGGVLHIGVVVSTRAWDGQHYLVVHNLAAGAKLEDVLFGWPIIAHYRYFEPLN